MSVRDAVEATLVGRDIRLVQRCDIDRIVAALDDYGCYDVHMLTDALEASFGALQMQVGDAAAPAFLALLKAYLRKQANSAPTSTPQSASPSTPPTGAPPSFVPPVEPAPTTLQVIITVKLNGKTIAERSSLPLRSTATWEEAARLRLGEQASDFASMPLNVSLFPNGQQVTCPPLVLGRPCLVLHCSCSGRSLRAPTRSNCMSKPRSKRSMYSRSRSVDDRRVCCSQRDCDRVGASISAAVRPSTTTPRCACRKRRCPVLLQPRSASRGHARPASRRGSLPSSGRCSSRPASGRLVQRSQRRRGRRGSKALDAEEMAALLLSLPLMQEVWPPVGLLARCEPTRCGAGCGRAGRRAHFGPLYHPISCAPGPLVSLSCGHPSGLERACCGVVFE